LVDSVESVTMHELVNPKKMLIENLTVAQLFNEPPPTLHITQIFINV
jgi:hypothetical protein